MILPISPSPNPRNPWRAKSAKSVVQFLFLRLLRGSTELAEVLFAAIHPK